MSSGGWFIICVGGYESLFIKINYSVYVHVRLWVDSRADKVEVVRDMFAEAIQRQREEGV